LASAVDWIFIGLLGWAAARWFGVTAWMTAPLVAAWMVKDLLMYSSMRKYYQAEPAERRIVGEEGVALCTLDPGGFVRVHGEIWRAHVGPAERTLGEGARVRVCDVAGLLLRVEPVALRELRTSASS
jgi:membrane-bound ClpP family serine protease